MIRKQKVVAILPAYQAAGTLVSFLRDLPRNFFDEIILVDDCSTDPTFALAKRQRGITVYRTPRNLGYGGNLKTCLSRALEHGADVIVELHPDGEYLTDGIGPALLAVKKGAALVLGNRFAGHSIGMYWWKKIGTKILSAAGNTVLGIHIPDLHQGFRVYTRRVLEGITIRENSDNYLFSFEIIAQTVFAGLPIASVPVSTVYRGNKRGAPLGASIRYTLGTFWVLWLYLCARLGLSAKLFRLNRD